ncbi:pro-opiomelanocortin, partial [Neopelma chrysocephalum]|uniref:pro-opiomelanocortin n=1 Tax=Neopelma chrysocephalum TaxID=114329 RepID=UPI000FCD3914
LPLEHPTPPPHGIPTFPLIQECAAACRADLSLEAPLFPGNGQFQPLSESIRRYVMSHFRWNKFGRAHGNSSSSGTSKREEGAGNLPNSQRREEPGANPVPGGKEDGKRSYSMEHFRWGKPVGRKRRPVKVYPNGVEEEEEEEAQEFPLEFRRELGDEEEEGEKREEGKSRWESPLEKRYGGFMGSEKGRTPLVTLFRNTIGKSASKKGH